MMKATIKRLCKILITSFALTDASQFRLIYHEKLKFGR